MEHDGGAGDLAVEVYRDVAGPSAKIIGDTLGNVIRLLVRPVRAAIAKSDERYEQIAQSVNRRMSSIPPERWVEPAANVAGPALEAARFAAEDPPLREMYAKLLATAMDSHTAVLAHPAFVEIIKQLVPDEARLIKLFSRRDSFPCARIGVDGALFGGPTKRRFDVPFYSTVTGLAHLSSPIQVEGYLDNALRLGLLHRTDSPSTCLVTDETPEEFAESLATTLSHPKMGGFDTDEERARIMSELLPVLSLVTLEPRDAWCYEAWTLTVTEFGKHFCAACVDADEANRMA